MLLLFDLSRRISTRDRKSSLSINCRTKSQEILDSLGCNSTECAHEKLLGEVVETTRASEGQHRYIHSHRIVKLTSSRDGTKRITGDP